MLNSTPVDSILSTPPELIPIKSKIISELAQAEKISTNLTDKAIITKMVPFLLYKFPFTEVELRKLLRNALHFYRTQNEIAFEKIPLLNSEEKYEAFTKLLEYLRKYFEPLFESNPRLNSYIIQTFQPFVETYLPNFGF